MEAEALTVTVYKWLRFPLMAGIARSGMPMIAFVKRYPSDTLGSVDANKATLVYVE